jgi:hypothetical protein
MVLRIFAPEQAGIGVASFQMSRAYVLLVMILFGRTLYHVMFVV